MRRLTERKLCKVDGCDGSIASSGLCEKHRARMRRFGSLDLPNRRGRVKDQPLYSRWNRLLRAFDLCEEWRESYWIFFDAVGLPPTRHHVLEKMAADHPFGPHNFKWSLPLKVAFDASDPQARRAYNRDMRMRNPQYETRSFLKRYGMTLEQYRDLLALQHGVCAVCSEPETVMRGNPPRLQSLSVDHDHSTGKVRGLLCVNCNKILGHAHDEVAKLEKAIAYLKEHGK